MLNFREFISKIRDNKSDEKPVTENFQRKSTRTEILIKNAVQKAHRLMRDGLGHRDTNKKIDELIKVQQQLLIILQNR